ncbi:MAG TPA: hypothetical protein VMB85_21805 [Bryobacteraceae bacterium]|nr:hypothetical protein [Bryobacteraceae bacterium]
MRVAAVIFLLSLCACRDVPDYPLPQQSPSFENFRTHAVRVVDLAQGGADQHIVRDIIGGSSLPWRWTLQRPAVKVRIGFNTSLNYLIDFTIAAATFKTTGPVTIAFTVNDHVLDRVRYTSPGPKHFEKPVPREWIQPHQDAIAGAEIDKVWVSKDDGAHLGFILSRIGLVER